MDFASLMSAQITKGKKDSPSTVAATAPSESSKKYLKRAEVEAQRQQAYIDEQAVLQAERVAKIDKKRKADEEKFERNAQREEKRRRLAEESKARREEEEARKERARRKRLGLPDVLDVSASSGDIDGNTLGPGKGGEGEDIPDPELTAKLRNLSEPTILFGETHAQRLSRYRTITAVSLTQSRSSGPIPTILGLVPEAEMRVPSKIPSNPEALPHLYRQLASYFTLLLREWAHALSQREQSVKDSQQGRIAASALTQSITSMTPLFRLFETSALDSDLLSPLLEIVSAAQERRYVDANDGYLRLSIGKAAWPIGVTMVGIHERSAREKLGEGEGGRAHIMSDEGTRKWLQSIKRCLSFAQTRWPPEDIGQLMG